MNDKTKTLQPAIRSAFASTYRRAGSWIFVILFVSYGYFHQGGGWNQNSRFDQVRSIVENQQLEINEYFRYRSSIDATGHPRIVRLTGRDKDGLQFSETSPNSLDISLFEGKVYPNKPPGTVFLGVPAYWLIYRIESFFEVDPDQWWAQTVNAFLMTTLSVGLVAALGGVLFLLISVRLFPAAPAWTHVAATLTYGLGTLYFPFATFFVDHDLVGAISLFAFWLLLVEGQGGFESFRASLSYVLVGVLWGLTLVVNYAAILTCVALLLYGLHTAKSKIDFAISALAGFAVPIMLLLWYDFVCFGSPFAIANTYQLGMFRSSDANLFGMLTLPRLEVITSLLFSSYRGLFFSSPVLLLAPLGLFLMVYVRRQWPEALLFAGIFVLYLLMNAGFNNWHAGWTFGPRYLIPAIPFISLPLTLVFGRVPRFSCALAAVSVALMMIITAVDPQVPNSTDRPIANHVLPLFGGEKFEMNGVLIEGPVSANPIGVYENWGRPASAIGSKQRKWHSFNLGEFIWPNSRWSLMPLIVFVGGCVWCLARMLKLPNNPQKLPQPPCNDTIRG